MASPGHATNPMQQGQTHYDPIKDLTPLSRFADTANVLVVSPELPTHSVQEFLALARSRFCFI